MSSQITASQIDRARACPASLALPIVSLPSNSDAERGTAIHRFLEVAVSRSREEALAEIPVDAPWRATCENINLEEIISEAARLECELTLAYNPITDTARAIGRCMGRNYQGVSKDEIAGTVDLIITKNDGSVLVVDYKTGHYPVYVADSGQLRLLGLMVAHERGLSQVSIAIFQIAEAGELRRDEMQLEAGDLDRIAASVRTIFTKVAEARTAVEQGRTPDVRVGGHCSYCPAFRACPANISLARGMLTTEQNIATAIKEMTPKEAGIVWERLAYAKRILNEIEEGLCAYIDQEPIPLPDGRREVTRVDSVRETIIGRAAVPVLYEHLGEAAEEVIMPSVSKSELEKLIKRDSVSAQEARAFFNEVMTSLRQVGAIKETQIVSYQARFISPKRA